MCTAQKKNQNGTPVEKLKVLQKGCKCDCYVRTYIYTYVTEEPTILLIVDGDMMEYDVVVKLKGTIQMPNYSVLAASLAPQYCYNPLNLYSLKKYMIKVIINETNKHLKNQLTYGNSLS